MSQDPNEEIGREDRTQRERLFRMRVCVTWPLTAWEKGKDEDPKTTT